MWLRETESTASGDPIWPSGRGVRVVVELEGAEGVGERGLGAAGVLVPLPVDVAEEFIRPRVLSARLERHRP